MEKINGTIAKTGSFNTTYIRFFKATASLSSGV